MLAYEAHDAARSHRVTAERALRDYASVAAWEFVANAQERLDAIVGGALSPLTSVRASSPYELLAPPAVLRSTATAALRCDAARGDSATIAFRVDLRDGSLAADGAASARTLAWLRDTVIAHTRLRYRPETRFAAVAEPGKPPGRIAVYGVRYAQHGAPLAAYGFTTCPRAIVEGVLRGVAADHPLLPSAVTGGAANDSLLVIAVSDANGAHWFRSAPSTVMPSGGEAALDAMGVPLIVRAWLRASAPEVLFVGRPPRTRLPILVGLLALTAALAVIAVLQLRREHDLARLRADFTSSVSHELRTPLAQILLFGETLKLGRVRSEEDRQLAAETIVQEARRLMHLVDNVLHFARTTERRAAVDPQRTELAPLLSSIVAAFAPLADERGAHVVVEMPEDLSAFIDPAAFRQIVLNLLGNALTYGPPRQTIRVVGERVGDRVRVAVEDEGPGIPAADRERIWSPYVRLHRDRNAAHGGAGLGLAVVRELARLQRGDAFVEDAATGGSRFVVEVPAEPGSTPSAVRLFRGGSVAGGTSVVPAAGRTAGGVEPARNLAPGR